MATDGACSGADSANAGRSAVAFDALRGSEFRIADNRVKPSAGPDSFFQSWWRIEQSQTRGIRLLRGQVSEQPTGSEDPGERIAGYEAGGDDWIAGAAGGGG